MRHGLPTAPAALWLWGLAVVAAVLLASCGGQTATPSPTAAPDEPPPVAVVTAGLSPTAVSTPTADPSPTSTAIPAPPATPVPTNTPTPVPTETPAPMPTDTPISVRTETPTPALTDTPTPLPTETPTPLPTETPTPVPTETPTPAPTATPTPTAREIAADRLSGLLSWFDDPPDDTHSAAAEEIVSIWLVDVDLANEVVGLGWLADDVTIQELRALEALEEVASDDLELARNMASLTWFADGVSDSERQLLGEIKPLTRQKLRLIGAIASLPWFVDGVTPQEERGAIHVLCLIASMDADLARLLVSYEWLADDVNYNEWGILHTLNELASSDLELARTVAGYIWLADEVAQEDWWALSRLHEVAVDDVELARAVAGYSSSSDDAYLLLTLIRIADRGEDKLAQLTAQPWFTDGIDDEEAALLIALEDAAWDARNLFVSLARNRYTQSKNVTLPLSGEVNFWAFQAIPFPRNKDVVGMMEEAVRASETLFGTAFPMKDVIVVLQPVGGATRNYGGQFRGDHIRVVMYDFSDVNRGVVYHEVAHYYLRGGLGPTWLVEGGAEFAVAYVRDQVGEESLEVRTQTARTLVRANCHNHGVSKISKLIEQLEERADSLFLCNYSLGAYFLHNLFDRLGEEAMAAAFRDLLLLQKSTGRQLSEREIYQTFKANVPRGREDAFNEAYRQWHGGDFIDP